MAEPKEEYLPEGLEVEVVSTRTSERQQVLPAVKALLDATAAEHDVKDPDKFPDEHLRVLAKATAWSR